MKTIEELEKELEAAKKTIEELTSAQQQLAQNLKPHLAPKTAAKVVADHFNINKKMVYEFILKCD